MTNPKTGWMQNCNTTPFLLTSEGSNLDPKKYPSYMVQESDNPRGAISRRILSAKSKFTFEEWTRAAFDTYVFAADTHLPKLLIAIEHRLGSGKPSGSVKPYLRDVHDELTRWDRRSTNESVAMTLFTLWRDRMGANRVPPEVSFQQIQCLIKC